MPATTTKTTHFVKWKETERERERESVCVCARVIVQVQLVWSKMKSAHSDVDFHVCDLIVIPFMITTSNKLHVPLGSYQRVSVAIHVHLPTVKFIHSHHLAH